VFFLGVEKKTFHRRSESEFEILRFRDLIETEISEKMMMMMIFRFNNSSAIISGFFVALINDRTRLFGVATLCALQKGQGLNAFVCVRRLQGSHAYADSDIFYLISKQARSLLSIHLIYFISIERNNQESDRLLKESL